MKYPEFTLADYITGEKYQRCCDVNCEDNQKLSSDYAQKIQNSGKSVLSIFCQTHNLKTVVPALSEMKNKRFVLVSHNSDGVLNYHDSGRWFDYQWKPVENIRYWISQNVDIEEPNVIPIPVAVENTYIFKPEIKQQLMNDLAKAGIEKDMRAFMCFNVATNPTDRGAAQKYFSNKPWCSNMAGYNNIKLVKPYFEEMAKHRFVISPEGNGLDVIRTWEAIYMGCIPIVKPHVFTKWYARQLPIIVVNSWEDVTPEFLEKMYDEMKDATYNFELLRMSFWKCEIERYKKLCEGEYYVV